MNQEQSLRDSHGPEATPYQHSHPQPPEAYGEGPQYLPGGQRTGDKEAPPGSAATKPGTRLCGLSKKVFWLVVAVIICVGLGVGLGAGLGVGLKHDDNSNRASPDPSATPPSTISSAAPASTTTTPAPVTSGVQGIAANSCTFKDPKTYRAKGGAVFVEYCFTDWPNGIAASSGDGNVQDLKATIAYTFEACMEDCVDYNSGRSAFSGQQRCLAVTYNANLTSAVGAQGGNCFLKNNKGVEVQGSDVAASAALVL